MIRVVEDKKIIPFDKRIKSVQIINGGSAIEVTWVKDTQNIPDFSKEIPESLEYYFPIVKASELSLEDEFLQHNPETPNQRSFKERLIRVIKSGISDFRAQKIAPSFDAKGNITYKYGDGVATKQSVEWWYDKAKEFMPERNSRLGTTDERIAFLGTLLKELISGEKKIAVDEAWKAICDDNTILEKYMDCLDTESIVTTGNGEIGSWYDLRTAATITVEQEEELKFSLVGGCRMGTFPLADIFSEVSCDKLLYTCTGWIVLSV